MKEQYLDNDSKGESNSGERKKERSREIMKGSTQPNGTELGDGKPPSVPARC